MKNTYPLARNVRKILTPDVMRARQGNIPFYTRQVLIGQLLGDCSGYRTSPTANTRLEWSFGGPYMNYAS